METTRYGKGAIALHWLIAAFILFEIGLGWRMEGKPGAELYAVYQLHKSVGITIFLLSLIRLGWRYTHRPPPLSADLKRWERALATGTHHGFYLLMIGLPLSGWLLVSSSDKAIPTLLYGLIPWPHVPGVAASHGVNEVAEVTHKSLVWVAYGLFFLHVAGALKHHFVDKSQDAARMLPVVASRLGLALGVVLAFAAGALAFGNRVPLVAARLASPARQAAAVSDPVVPVAASETDGNAATTDVTKAEDEETAKEADEAAEAAKEAEEAPAGPVSSHWTVNRSASSVGYATSWNGTALTGGFGRWSADIDFDPAALAKAHVRVEIDMASVSASDGSAESALPGADWFDAGSHPKAVFEARDFRSLGGNRYEARGTLAMRGVSRPLSLPFTLDIKGDEARMRGSASLDRLAYGIGQGEWTATDSVPARVNVNVKVTARRK